jgi:hypothetical protein
MSTKLKTIFALGAAALFASTSIWAKLPAPALSDEAKAKAAEAAAKTAHAGKVDAYQLCKSMDRVSAGYHAARKKAGAETKVPTATPPCVDPGAFVYPPPVAGAPAGAAATVAAAAPAVSAAKKAGAAATAPKK